MLKQPKSTKKNHVGWVLTSSGSGLNSDFPLLETIPNILAVVGHVLTFVWCCVGTILSNLEGSGGS